MIILIASEPASPEEVKLTWDGKLLIPAMENFLSVIVTLIFML
ncbi:hypothetical protein PQ689_09960 [Thermoanaerobacterium thermosaccharolyticum]